jgi:tRNA1(Val) A37 N6-methylase TrmN6
MSLDHDADVVKQQTPTRDAFLGGRLHVSQPSHGFRAGLDSVLLGAAVDPAAASLLDLGAGVGAASLVALAHHSSRTATLAERDEAMLALAAGNLAANGFADRARVVGLDVTATGAARSAAGLPADHFASVIANPPFFDPAAGTAPAAARAAARHMQPAALDLWARSAAAHAAPGGEVIFIHAAASLPALLSVLDRRFGALALLPLCPRPGEAATRVLVRGIKGSRAPLTLLASRALHAEEGRGFLPEFDAVFRGRDRLHW